MKYIIVPTEWLIRKGIDVTYMRKSVDESKIIVDKNFIQPILRGRSFEEYDFDDPQLVELMNSPEWLSTENITV